MTGLKVAVVSLTSTDNPEKNLASAEKLILDAVNDGAKWVVLPEMLGFMGPYDKHHDHGVSEADLLNHKTTLLSRLAKLAKTHRIVLFAGSLGERPTTDITGQWQGKEIRKVFNTLYVFGRDGELAAKYQKTHLFNLMDQKGQPLYCESDCFIPGNGLVACEIDGYRVGLAICYDLRFPELFTKVGNEAPVDVWVIPSAFTMQTGMDHWELLLRARAVENQCYVVASNQTGTHSPGKQSYGHSMIVDPWGHKICDTGEAIGIGSASLSKERIAEVRARLPALANRRPELY